MAAIFQDGRHISLLISLFLYLYIILFDLDDHNADLNITIRAENEFMEFQNCHNIKITQ